MIALAPIHEDIRKTLFNRSQAVSRDFDGKDPLAEKSPHEDTFKSTFSKAIWVRVFSPVDSTVESIQKVGEEDKDGNPIFQKVHNSKKGLKYSTIFGGEVSGINPDGTVNEKPFEGFDELYANRSGTKEGILETVTGGLKRPISGIKDISVSYKGGLSAIREASINWTCWSFQDLNRLSPHFMAHGKGVLLEWGWSIPDAPDLDISNEEDMINGTAYSLLQNRIIENKGNYDAMAGVISNWEWSLREDGGIDCTTTIVSRGVNMLNASLDNPGKPPDAGDDAGDGPTMSLPEFMSAFKETLLSLSAVVEAWPFGVEDMKPLTPKEDWDSWNSGKKSQPPGIFTPVRAGNFFTEKKCGPYVSWGWFEDNVLSRFLGKYDGSFKTTSSFRSIEPKLYPDNSGKFLMKNGNPTSNIHEAEFQPVVIRNHRHLYTPDRNRWLLPGQFPAQNTAPENFEKDLPWWAFVAELVINLTANLLYTKWDEQLTQMVAHSVQGIQGEYFDKFAVDKDWNKGGYLRNILISWELLEEAFKDAKTTKEGVNAILTEINADTDGFWNFQMVGDPYVEGNIKVIDVNRTAYTVSDLLDDRKANENAGDNDEFGNPGSKLFTFPSWGEKSIVKSQTLTAKLPSSMQVTAMYSGTSTPGTANSAAAAGDDPGTAVGGLHGESVDESQKDIKMAWERIGFFEQQQWTGAGVTAQKFAPYGSKNPYNLTTDGERESNVPSGENFGHGKGINFEFIDWYTVFGWGKDPASKKPKTEREEDQDDLAAEKKIDQAAKTEDAKKHYYNVAGPDGNWDGADTDHITGWAGDGVKNKKLWDSYKDGFTLYDEDGIMWLEAEDGIVFHELMKDHIHGRVSGIPVEDRNKVDVMAPVELEITLDGCGGIIPGNAFHVDYIPEEYQKYCLFQVLGVDQTVGTDSWNTTIKGQIRIDSNRRISDKLGVIEKKEKDLKEKNEAKKAYLKKKIAENEAAKAANPPDPPTDPSGTPSGTDDNSTSPAAANTPQDEEPKPDKIKMVEKDQQLDIEDILFNPNKTTFTEKKSATETLDKLADLMKDNPTMEIEVSGHTASGPSSAALLTLSQDRADAIKNHLVSNGISGNRIISVGKGDTEKLWVSGAPPPGFETNRRVEFLVTKT